MRQVFFAWPESCFSNSAIHLAPLKKISRDDEFRSLEIKTEAHFLQARRAHRVAQPGLVLRVLQPEAAAARADELAAERAAGQREVIPLVDLGIAHAAAALLLALPVNVHQPRELGEVAAFERGLALQAEVFDEVQILDHGLVVRFRFHVLLLQNRRRTARIAGEK